MRTAPAGIHAGMDIDELRQQNVEKAESEAERGCAIARRSSGGRRDAAFHDAASLLSDSRPPFGHGRDDTRRV
jgi:hypothetical protein